MVYLWLAANSKSVEALALSAKDVQSTESLTNLQSPFIMKTFYNKSLSVAPYATTSLISAPSPADSSAAAAAEATFQAIQQGKSMIEPDYNEIDNCSPGGHNLSTSDSNNDTQNMQGTCIVLQASLSLVLSVSWHIYFSFVFLFCVSWYRKEPTSPFLFQTPSSPPPQSSTTLIVLCVWIAMLWRHVCFLAH